MARRRRVREFALALLLPALAFAQDAPVSVDVGAPSSRRHAAKLAKSKAERQRVRAIAIEGGWSGHVKLPLAVCDVITAERISAALEALRDAIDGAGGELSAFGAGSAGAVRVIGIDVDYDTAGGAPVQCPGGPASVGVTFKPYKVELSLERYGDNVLPLPRLPFARFQTEAERKASALQPRFGVDRDRSFGTSLDAKASLNPAAFGVAPGSAMPLESNFRLRKSLDETFYEGAADFSYRGRRPTAAIREYTARGAVDASHEPLAGGEVQKHSVDIGGGLTVDLAAASSLSLNSAWRRSHDRVNAPDGAGAGDSTRSLDNRLLLDKLVSSTRGTLRGALWQGTGHDDAGQSFQRLALRAGYAQEIRWRPNQTIGLEILAGAGRAYGVPPPALRFFGGNSSAQFLYDSPSSAQLLAMPRGPLLRSFGQGQASLRDGGASSGGTSFWHVNMNLAWPVRAWSRPLIPDEQLDITDAQGEPITLKRLLRTQIDRTGPNMLAAVLQNEGLSPADAAAKAQSVFASIQPGADYIVEDANLYALRPLLMLDMAGLADASTGRSARWTAVGIGARLTIVVAHIEAGYMRTVSGPDEGGRGALFMRVVMQNLF